MSLSNAFIDQLNIDDGKITYNDFDIDENRQFYDQEYSYKQDILQIEFGERYVLDVGWYPEFDPKGYFLVRAIEDYDWLKPLLAKKCRSLKELKKAIEETANILSLKNRNKS